MKLEFLVATINRTESNFINSIFRNICLNDCFVLVINQCIDIPLTEVKYPHESVSFISVKGNGTSSSRNIAIKNMRGDIGVFTDDDVVYTVDAIQTIMESYSKYPYADIITFQSVYFSGKYLKNYKHKTYTHNRSSLKNIADIEISFKRNAIVLRKLYLDEMFGLGASFPLGEYLIFLNDCYKKKCKMQYYPKIIVSHPDCIHSGIQFNSFYEIGRGALFRKLSPLFFWVYNIYFAIKKYSMYKNKHSFLSELYYLFTGNFKYINYKK